jgi:crossover junction endodeoxyribonuclease RuvC
MSERYFIGVDPGASGSICAINEWGFPILVMSLKDQTNRDIMEALQMMAGADKSMNGVLERVHAMPKQGVSSTFKFGTSFGALGAHLTWAGVRFELVTPHKWQGALGCLSRGDKNVTKRKAQEMFPNIKVTHAIADGLLMALYSLKFGLWREEAIDHRGNTG